MNSAISLTGLSKSFQGVEVFHSLNLEIEKGKITAIVGPNGCGKSTLLNILAGIEKEDGGVCQCEELGRFDTSYIFQNYRESLLPWKNNRDNVALPLRFQGKSDGEVATKIERLEQIFNVKLNPKNYPYTLSGGQQQILAFMRALVTDPQLLLIDEPFSALDYENSLRLRDQLQKYYLDFKPTVLLVTHSIEEAVHLASKIVVMSAKPTRVLEIIDNPLPYPRDLQTIKTVEFHQCRDRVLTAFQKAAQL